MLIAKITELMKAGSRLLVLIWCLVSLAAGAQSAETEKGKIFERHAPYTMAELGRMNSDGVSVVEVSDYVFGGYKGGFASPPHADLNPKKAFVVTWNQFPYRFV